MIAQGDDTIIHVYLASTNLCYIKLQ